MTCQLNDIPNNLLSIFAASDYSVTGLFDAAAPSDIYPDEVTILFDCDLEYFYSSLQDCFLNKNNFKIDSELIDALKWQVRQVYRIVNSLLGSNNPAITFKNELNYLKKELCENKYLKPLLVDIKSGKLKPDIICSGEGYWVEGDGDVTFNQSTATVVMYIAPGMVLMDDVGWDIENSRFKYENTVLKNIDTNKELFTKSLVKEFNSTSSTTLHNYTLTCRDDLRARFVETLTGEILETPLSITLNEIVQKYKHPQKIHWVACTEMFDKEYNQIGKFMGLCLDKLPQRKLKTKQYAPIRHTKTYTATLFQTSAGINSGAQISQKTFRQNPY